jgi:TetR/AcrR family transcriptional regulator, regulator of mycofactocin system
MRERILGGAGVASAASDTAPDVSAWRDTPVIPRTLPARAGHRTAKYAALCYGTSKGPTTLLPARPPGGSHDEAGVAPGASRGGGGRGMLLGEPARALAADARVVRPVPAAVPVARAGRRPVTSRAELEHVAFDLFDRQGFERTTVDDIARAAGIGRRTFFRYFPSKNDVAWGDFDAELERMRLRLKALPPQLPLMEAIRAAIVDFNTFAPEQIGLHRRRMRLILQTPALQAHSTLRYAAWRQVIDEFAAERTGQRPDALAPRTIGYVALGVAIAAYEQWLETDAADLSELMDSAMRQLAAAFADGQPSSPAVVTLTEPSASGRRGG